jgi:hypothetical protein
VNEIQLIRAQLIAERNHASAVAAACAAAGSRREGLRGEFGRACVDYLVLILAWFEERDQRAADLARALRPGAKVAGAALEEALAQPGRSREALQRLERAVAAVGEGAAADASRSWQEFARYFNGAWSARRDAIDARLAEGLRAADWRAVAGVDADSILEERQHFARVRASVPPGVALAASATAPAAH